METPINKPYDKDWCYYSDLPSPIHYLNMKEPILIQHKSYPDNRGSYTPIPLDIEDINWTQCSISTNDKEGTFRGMHYQTNPPQTKYIKVIKGSIIDFIYDLNTGELYYYTLNSDNALLIPNHFAHGFLTLEDNTIVSYLVEGEWNPNSEKSIVWHTIEELKKIVQENTVGELIISDKDANGK